MADPPFLITASLDLVWTEVNVLSTRGVDSRRELPTDLGTRCREALEEHLDRVGLRQGEHYRFGALTVLDALRGDEAMVTVGAVIEGRAASVEIKPDRLRGFPSLAQEIQAAMRELTRVLEAPVIERNEEPTEDELQRYSKSIEKLIGAVERLLQDGAWESQPDVESDVTKSLETLRNENFRDVDARDQLIVERLATRLSRYVIQHEKVQADEERRAALDKLNTAVFDLFDTLDGTGEDPEKIRPAVQELAGNLAWSEIKPPDSVEEEAWTNFVEYAEEHPVETLETAFGWRDRIEFAAKAARDEHSKSELAATAGLTGLVSQAISAGLGATGVASTVLNYSPLGAVIAMLVTTFAVNFRRAKPDQGEES